MEKLETAAGYGFSDLWRQHSLWIILLVIAFAFDTISTINFMMQDGIHLELNPLVKYSALTFGPVTGTILSAFLYKSIVALWLALNFRPLRVWVLTVPIVPAIIAGLLNFS